MTDPRALLEAMWNAEPADRERIHEPLDLDAVIVGWSFAHPMERAAGDMDGLKSLALYCQRKGQVSVTVVKSDWARIHGYVGATVEEYLTVLVSCALVELQGDRVRWISD